MARIRSIKPEFPQSESMGRVSRDARLLFLQMWTLADDEGRLRGNSRMLASLLFPYDLDAGDLIDGWLEELVVEDCIKIYSANGGTYIQITKWLIHQKIDRPSKSKIPPFDESSRILANPPRRIKDQGSKDQGKKEAEPDLPEMPPPTDPDGSALDPKVLIFSQGVKLLVSHGEPEKTARTFLARYAKDGNETKLAGVIGQLMAQPKIEPKSYIAKAMAPKKREVVL